MVLSPPFRIEVDVSVSTFPCAGHGEYRCFAILCPGEVCYQRSTTGERVSYTLCQACGERAVSELQRFVRAALLAGLTQAPPTP